MADETHRGMGWATIVVAALEAALVLLWVSDFAMDTGPSSPHFRGYVLYPLAFLPAPALVAVGSRYLFRPLAGEKGCLIAWALWVLLGINFVLFAVYAAMSGGGM